MLYYMLHPGINGTVLRKGGKWVKLENFQWDMAPPPGSNPKAGVTEVGIFLFSAAAVALGMPIEVPRPGDRLGKPADVTIEVVSDKPPDAGQVRFSCLMFGAFISYVGFLYPSDTEPVCFYRFKFERIKFPMGRLRP